MACPTEYITVDTFDYLPDSTNFTSAFGVAGWDYIDPGGGSISLVSPGHNGIGKQIKMNFTTVTLQFQGLLSDFLGDACDKMAAGGFYFCEDAVTIGVSLIRFIYEDPITGVRTIQVSLDRHSNGKLLVSVGAFTSVSSFAIKENNVYFIEMYAKLDTIGITGEVIVKVNNETVISLTGIGTSPADLMNKVCFGGLKSASKFDRWDNIYTNINSSGLKGDISQTYLRPSANGALQQWTPNSGVNHFDRINEVAADSDTTYLHTETGFKEETNAHDNLPVGFTILTVQQVIFARKATSAGALFIEVGSRQGGINYWGVEDFIPQLDLYQFFYETFTVNPATGLTWVLVDIDAAEFGFRSQS